MCWDGPRGGERFSGGYRPAVHHDDLVSAAVAAARATDPAAVTAAWVASLTTRDLPARSAFGSLAVLRHLPGHPFTPSARFHPSRCGVCGLAESTDGPEPERVAGYPFQVRHTDVEYALADLATFPDRAVPVPTAADTACLRAILDAVRALAPTAGLAELRQALTGLFRSNKHQRTILLEQLGYAGILCPADQRHYAGGFVPYDDAESRQPPEYYKREWAYPIRFWTGADGVDEALVRKHFGAHLA